MRFFGERYEGLLATRLTAVATTAVVGCCGLAGCGGDKGVRPTAAVASGNTAAPHPSNVRPSALASVPLEIEGNGSSRCVPDGITRMTSPARGESYWSHVDGSGFEALIYKNTPAIESRLGVTDAQIRGAGIAIIVCENEVSMQNLNVEVNVPQRLRPNGLQEKCIVLAPIITHEGSPDPTQLMQKSTRMFTVLCPAEKSLVASA